MNINQDLRIDPDGLDVEWLQQSELYYEYAKKHADAKRAVAEAAERKKTIRSQLILEARKKGDAKNAGQEEAYYRTRPLYQEAVAELIDAEHVAGLLLNAVFAFQQRKEALENLVRLAGQNYFATPSVPRDLAKELELHKAGRKEIVRDKKRRGRRWKS